MTHDFLFMNSDILYALHMATSELACIKETFKIQSIKMIWEFIILKIIGFLNSVQHLQLIY